MTRPIDLNADVGERPDALADGSEARLIRLLTSANIACGGHAGDEASMRAIVRIAREAGVAVGAHPGYADRAGFGRREITTNVEELRDSVFAQVRTLGAIAHAEGSELVQVKPHGALYNRAARDASVAQAVAEGVAMWSRSVILVGLAGSACLEHWRAQGFRVVGEGFVDRRYEPDGSLRARTQPDALITDPEEAAAQAVAIARDGRVRAVDGTVVAVEADTICVHSDTPGAESVARLVRERLLAMGVVLAPVACR